MTIPLTINGSTYDYPESGDDDWGNEATGWAEAVTGGMLQKAGGAFFLLAEVDFGASFGLKSIYYKSRTATPATAGQFRLARVDVINWRNQANDGNLSLAVNSSDALTWNGTSLQNTLSVLDTATINLTLAADVLSADIITGSITNAMINASAAIAYSKLALSNSIVNADVNSAAAIAYSKLALTGSIVNADVSASAAIAYSKLAALTSANILVGSGANVATSVAMTGDIGIGNTGVTAIAAGVIVDADVNAAAAIALTKLAAMTASRAVVSDASGFLVPATTTAAEIGYVNGVTSSIQTQLDAKVLKSLYTAKGMLLGASAASTPVGLAVGIDGQVLIAASGNASGLGWGTALANPMDAAGQLIYGAASGTATKVPAGSANQVLQSNGTSIPTWVLLVNANIDAAAAIAYSKLALTGSIVNADVNASAAIAYSKLALTGAIVNADINASAAIAYSKLALTASIVNADIGAAAAIAYSKLNLTGSIVNADINASAAIAVSKLSGTLPVAQGGTAVTSVTIAPTASSFAGWDANSNLSAVSHIEGFTTIATAAGTTTLVVGSTKYQYFTGSTTQTLKLPVTSTLVAGQEYRVFNQSTGNVTVQSSGSNTIRVLSPGQSANFVCILISGTTAASWSVFIAGGAPTIQTFASGTGTYTTPINAKYLRVRMVGGGGGGGCSGSAGGTAINGDPTTFGTAFLSAAAGLKGAVNDAGGVGGQIASIPAGAIGSTWYGENGQSTTGGGTFQRGGLGGGTIFGGRGTVTSAVAGGNGYNTTGGGGGGGSSGASSVGPGSGGGGGCGIDVIISAPLTTYAYVVGGGGAGASAGTNGFAGGNGGAGYIEVTEFY